MGAVYGVINLLIGAWFYNSAHTVKKPAITWAAIGAGVFLACLISGYGLNYLLQLVSGEDTTAMSPSQSSTGADFNDYGTNFLAIMYEFIPLIFGLVGSAVVRSVFLLNTGIKDSFSFVKSIKLPFKKDNAESVDTKASPESSDKTDSAD